MAERLPKDMDANMPNDGKRPDSYWKRFMKIAIPSKEERNRFWREPSAIFTETANWNRVFLLMLLIAAITNVAGLFFGFPVDHHLQRVPSKCAAALEVVKFEASYFVYLAGITIPTLGGVLTLLLTSRDFGNWRKAAVSSVNLSFYALTLVTCGYALRNGWMVLDEPIPGWLANLDKFVVGPFTAVAYILALWMLAKMAYAGLPHVMPTSQ